MSGRYSSFSSMPTAERPDATATASVVPEPAKGSSTVPPAGLPASTQGSMSFGGITAKCAPLKGLTGTSQTDRRCRSPSLGGRLPL